VLGKFWSAGFEQVTGNLKKHGILEVIYQQLGLCVSSGYPNTEKLMKARPQAKCFCFEVFEYPDETRSPSC